MIKLRTEIDMPQFKRKMGYRRPSMMIGSCFAESMGNYLLDLCFPIQLNPFGILYNPVSIANSLGFLIEGKRFTEQDLFYANGVFNSFFHHSRFSDNDPVKALESINFQATEASDALKNCSHLFITFGTSWVFTHKSSGFVVSNCHKLPAATFEHFRLSVAQITDAWLPLIGQLRSINPELQIIFTVSPIRHLKDGAHENQLSKSTLLIAIENLISKDGNDLISYFPSYELVLDELRDYRFYASDMTHLSETAVDFIREKFTAAILDQEAKNISSELEKILPSLKHRPMNNNDSDYISFIDKQIEKSILVQNKYPFVDVKLLIKKFFEKRAD